VSLMSASIETNRKFFFSIGESSDINHQIKILGGGAL